MTLTGSGLAVAPPYTDTITLTAGTPYTPVTSAESPSGAGVVGSFDNGVLTGFSNGSVTVTNLAYSEVGSFTLKATAATAFLNTTSVDLNPRLAIYALQNNAAGATIGRFNPARFVLSGGAVINRSDVGGGLGCTPQSAFTYIGEPLRANFTLTAVNTGGVTTANYSPLNAAGALVSNLSNTGNSYVKFKMDVSPAGLTNWYASWTSTGLGGKGLWMVGTNYPVSPGSCRVRFDEAAPWNTIFDCAGGATSPAPIAGIGEARVGVSTSSIPTMTWSSGVGTFAADVLLERAAVPDGPYGEIRVAVAPKDEKGVATVSTTWDTDADGTSGNELIQVGSATQMRFGRLRLLNAIGSERLNLPVAIRTEYWNGSVFLTNTSDNCTQLSTSNFSLPTGDYNGGITTINMPPATSVVLGNNGAFAAGVGSLRLNKPVTTPSRKGSLKLCVDLEQTRARTSCWLVLQRHPRACHGCRAGGEHPRRSLSTRSVALRSACIAAAQLSFSVKYIDV